MRVRHGAKMLTPQLQDAQKDDCVLVVKGLGWPANNFRVRTEPATVCDPNSVGYRIGGGGPEGVSRVLLMRNELQVYVPEDDLLPIDPTQTGDNFKFGEVYDQKICATCFVLKPLGEFPKNRQNKQSDGVERIKTRPHCEPCYASNTGKKLTARRRREYLEKHGKERGTPYRCPACDKLIIVGVTAELNVDHDQNTGEPRGLICGSCNTSLGAWEDPHQLQLALEYLESRKA